MTPADQFRVDLRALSDEELQSQGEACFKKAARFLSFHRISVSKTKIRATGWQAEAFYQEKKRRASLSNHERLAEEGARRAVA